MKLFFMLTLLTFHLQGGDNIKKLYWDMFEKGQYEQSYQLLVREMNGGSAWAMGRIGELYKTCAPEFMVVCDRRRGAKFIQQAALKGDIRAQSNLAGMYWKLYESNRDNRYNLDKAIEWYTLAAKNKEANFTQISAIATLYYYTPEVKDHKKAFAWYLYGAEKGIRLFMNKVSEMYLKGDGVKRDINESKRWLKKSKK